MSAEDDLIAAAVDRIVAIDPNWYDHHYSRPKDMLVCILRSSGLAAEVLRLREVAKEARRVQAARLAGSVTETWPEGGGMDGTAPQRVIIGWDDHFDWTPFDAALASLPSPEANE